MCADSADIVRSVNQAVTPLILDGDVDVITGDPLTPDEINFRLQIHEEAARGYIAVDATYASLHLEIHQPIVPADLEVIDQDPDADHVTLKRPSTALQLPLALGLGEPGQDGVVELIRHAVGEYPARVMHHLYAIANDPPYYRRNQFRISISDLLDRLGHTRDRRGIHYSANRKKMTRTLFALHLTRIDVTRRTRKGRNHETLAFSAPLLESVGYLTRENNDAATVREAFEQGLPEIVEIIISQRFYEGVRRDDGRPGRDYRLLKRPETPRGERGRRGPKPGGAHRGQSRTADLLRAYIQRLKENSQSQRAVVERNALLEHAGITNRNVSMAVTTLKRALNRLIEEGTLSAFQIKPSKVDELFELCW